MKPDIAHRLTIAAVQGRPYRPKPPDEISRNMAAIRSKENKTERALRSALHRRGLRFRKYSTNLPGKPDIVFPRARVAVFVDGDYWHARVLRESGEQAVIATIRGGNVEYWLNKFKRNLARDEAANAALEQEGWHVIRYWESDVKRVVEKTADRIAKVVRSRTRRRRNPARR